MRILLYKDNLSTGRGADHAVCSLANGLAERGYNTTVVTCPQEKPLSFTISDSVQLVYLSRKEIRDFSATFDLCIAAGPNEIMDLTSEGKCRPPCKTITELLVYPKGFFKWKRFIRNFRLKRAFNLSDVLQIQCPSYATYVRSFAPNPTIVTIGNWAEATTSVDPINTSSAAPSTKKVILYPAAVNKLKNQSVLIKGFSRIAKEFPDWELHLYGRHHKTYGPTCVNLVKAAGLQDQIKFFDFTDDLASVYRQANILAYPSLLEGFPLAMLEGMCFNLPVIAVDKLPAVHDMVLHNQTGLVAKNSPSAIAASLRKLMSDDAYRSKLGQQAHDHCITYYSRDQILNQWEALIQTMISA